MLEDSQPKQKEMRQTRKTEILKRKDLWKKKMQTVLRKMGVFLNLMVPSPVPMPITGTQVGFGISEISVLSVKL